MSHSSTESEIISLDAGLQIHKIPALDFWDLISKTKAQDRTVNLSPSKTSERKQCNTQNSQRRLELSHVDFVSSNSKYSHEGTKL